MANSVSFYIFDDEEQVLATLRSLITKVYPDADIFEASDGEYAWNLLQRHSGDAVIISDIFLPRMSGVQLLQNVKSKDLLKDSYFIITSSSIDKDENLKALKHGADYLLNKPLALDEMLSCLKSASKLLNLRKTIVSYQATIEDYKQKLRDDIDKMKNIVVKVQTTKIPNVEKKISFNSDAAVWIAKQSGELLPKEIKDIENAASLSYIGKLYLPEKIIDDPVTRNGMIGNVIMSNVPVFARDMALLINSYENVADILYHVFENYDGSGFPEKVKGWQIPLGSRIIRVVFDFHEYLNEFRNDYSKAIDQLYHESKRLYDIWVVAHFDQYLAVRGIGSVRAREKSVKIKELISGLTLSRNIVLESGIILMGEGTVIKEEQIEKIIQISKSDPIIGNIFIYSK